MAEKTKDEIQEKFGVTTEEVSKSKEIIPTLDVSKFIGKDFTKTLDVTFRENEPRELEHKDKETGEMIKSKVITVECLGAEYTLWLSAKSLAMPIAGIYQDHKGLIDVTVRIGKAQGNHPKYGATEYYRVQLVKDEQE